MRALFHKYCSNAKVESTVHMQWAGWTHSVVQEKRLWRSWHQRGSGGGTKENDHFYVKNSNYHQVFNILSGLQPSATLSFTKKWQLRSKNPQIYIPKALVTCIPVQFLQVFGLSGHMKGRREERLFLRYSSIFQLSLCLCGHFKWCCGKGMYIYRVWSVYRDAFGMQVVLLQEMLFYRVLTLRSTLTLC